MKRILLPVVLAFIAVCSYAQQEDLNQGLNIEEFWQAKYTENDMERHFSKNKYRAEARRGIFKEADDYLSSLENALYHDDYISDYIRTIFTGLAPQGLKDNRNIRLEVEILRSPNPDAYMLPNGVLLVSTGLLSTLDSVEELTAIIISEIAHYVYDDQYINVRKERARVQRAQVFGILLNVAAFATEIAITNNNDHYYPGGILVAAEITSAIISDAAIRKLGMGYSTEQILKADQAAVDFLAFSGMNSDALGSALTKIKHYYMTENDTDALSKRGAYKDINQRIDALGLFNLIGNRDYQKRMASIRTLNAMIQLNAKQYESAERLAMININNNFASDDDYVVSVQANMAITNSPESNKKNLELIRKAKSLSPIPNLSLYKEEILLLMRLDEEAQADEVLKEYVRMLNNYRDECEDDKEIEWASGEMAWAYRLQRELNRN